MTREELKIEVMRWTPALLGMGEECTDKTLKAQKAIVDMLEKQLQGDLISREDALNCFPLLMQGELFTVKTIRHQLKKLPPVEPQEWIPIKTRPLTKEEKEYYAEMGYSDDSVTFMYDCPLPDDGEEVLVTDSHGNVEFDTFIRDECDGCYFEENCDDGEVVAWKHKPSPYKGDE